MCPHAYVASMSQVLALSEAMLAHMQEGDWMAAQQLEQQRHDILASLPDFPQDEKSIADAIHVVSAASQCNQKLLELGNSQLQGYAEAKKMFDRRRQAGLAYSL